MAEIQKLEHLKFTLKDIMLATNNFADVNFITKGGFGRVYKGQLPGEPSTTVAVKRLDKMAGQGQREFLTEIVMLASYIHDNLVSLVGFSDEGDEKILVYKHEVNGSLDKHLASTDLTWEQRLRICLGAARGLDFLHCDVGTAHRVLHRDIKSSNILLGGNWEAKISDFGLSKIGLKNLEFTFIVTDPVGTYGYIDPQYLKTGIFSKESDVYSFGVVMFEVLCGRLAFIEKYHDVRRFLDRLAKLRYEEGKLDEIVMASLLEQMNPCSLQTFSEIAYKCLNKDRKQRPTMKSIIQELTISLEFQIGKVTRTELFGTITGGYPWSLLLYSNQKLRKITIDHEDWIHSIGFTTQDSITGRLISSQHGGYYGPSGGKLTEIIIDDEEEIIEIVGTVGVTTGELTEDLVGLRVISSLCFMTNKKKHGPFGQETRTRFSKEWDVGFFAGFYGRAGSYLDGLGFYSKNTIYEMLPITEIGDQLLNCYL